LKFLHDAKGGRRLIACGDRNCCLHGFPDMLANPKRHAVYQRLSQVSELERVPDLSRSQHFLDGEMARADRLARQIKDLKVGDDRLSKRMAGYSHRIERLRSTLEHFHSVRGDDAPRALSIVENHKSVHRGVS
jgi:hypothetical protein